MKKPILKWILFSMLGLTLASCAFDKNTNEEDSQQQQDRQALMAKYNPVVGLYRGTVTTSSTVQQVELSLYVQDQQDGYTATGDPKFLPVLKATYHRPDVVQGDVMLIVSSLENGQVHMTNDPGAQSVAGALVVPYTVDAVINGSTMTGTVTVNAGLLGTLNATLVTKEAQAPTQGDQDQKNNEAEAIFAKVVGTYTGILSPPSASEPKQRIVLTLYVDQYNTTDRGPIPVLVARSQNLTYDPVGAYTAILSADYQPDANPPKITLVSTSVVQSPNSTYHLSIDGHISNGVITGDYSDNQRSHGQVVLTLQK